MSKILPILFYSMFLGFLFSCSPHKEEKQEITIEKTMDAVITRIYREIPENQFQAIDDAFILNFLTENEKHILASKYQYFRVNVPVTVSLMRSTSQHIAPFWLEPKVIARQSSSFTARSSSLMALFTS